MLCPRCKRQFTSSETECPDCRVDLVECLPDHHVSEDKFVQIARFDTRLEAEAIGHALDQYGIPFLVKSDDIGIFGPGHVMSTPQGASLWVPRSRSKEVEELLSCLFKRETEKPDA